MQIHSLHKNIYKLYSLVAPEKSRTGFEKLCEEQVKQWELLHLHGIPNKKKQKLVGISRATYYRRKRWLKCPIFRSKRPKNVRQSKFGAEVYSFIRQIRTENKTYGKAKICVILRRDFGVEISESSVGRITKKLRFPRSRSALRCKKKRKFNKHAKPFKFKKYNEMRLGENVQIDHMTVTRNGVTMKHFAGIERFSEHVYANVYCKANSTNAAKFLKEFIENAPYKVRSIQVDGGSEFMRDFEEVCRELAIPLFVLPPAKPTYNGKVERSNRIFREEFYDDLSEDTIVGTHCVGAIRELMKFLQKYNSYRPHSSLHGLTPLEYISKYSSGDSFGLTSV